MNLLLATILLICGTAFALLWPNHRQGFTILALSVIGGLLLIVPEVR